MEQVIGLLQLHDEALAIHCLTVDIKDRLPVHQSGAQLFVIAEGEVLDPGMAGEQRIQKVHQLRLAGLFTKALFESEVREGIDVAGLHEVQRSLTPRRADANGFFRPEGHSFQVALAAKLHAALAPPAHCCGQIDEHGFGFFPAQTGVSDALSVSQGLTRLDVLTPFHKMAFYHETSDCLVAGMDLAGDL